jgi:hypothetical protein
VGSRIAGLIGPAFVVATAVVCTSGATARADATELCDAGNEDWNVIVDASNDTASSTGFLCNYRVDRGKVLLADGSEKNLGESGVAVTIEYFCSAADGRERYEGVAGPRDTETYRDDRAGFLIHEEGPQAKNPANPQDDGIFSQFFTNPDGSPLLIGLMEKEWRLLNDQVFATIVVLTNERGQVDETDRFGVESGEAVARILADRHRSAAGCAIPAVASDPNATDAGGGGIPVEVVAGIGGVIVIGGYTVWRRKPGKAVPTSKTVAGSVPPHCIGIATLYDNEVAILDTLNEAEQEVRQKLERAEKIHTNNIIKAKMVVNIEIISVFGGSATDLATALRPAVLRRGGPGALGQMDTWKPPGGIGSGIAARIKALEAAASAAWSKVGAFRNQIEILLNPIEERIRNLPGVKNAQQLWEFHMNKLGEMINDLPKANAARAKLREFEYAVETAGDQVKTAQAVVRDAEAAVSHAETALNMKRNQLPPGFDAAQDALREAEEKLKLLQADVNTPTIRLSRADDVLQAARAKVSSLTNDARGVLAEIPQLEAALAQQRADLVPKQAQLDELGKALNRAIDRKQTKFNELMTGLNDLTPVDIDRQSKIAGQAQRELDAATAAGRVELSKEVEAARQAQHAATVEAASAQGALDDLRAQAERNQLNFGTQAPNDGGVLSAIGRAIHWASAPIRYPLGIAAEIVFGVGQSPAEIMEILLQGRHNVHLLRSHLGAIKRAAYEQKRKVQKFRRQLDACTGSKTSPVVDIGNAA